MAAVETLTITLPAEIYRRLEEQAKQTGKPPEQLTLEILEQILVPETRSTLRTAAEVLTSLGRVSPLSPQLQANIIPGVTLEEVQEALSRAGGKPLSEIIIEQRGPRK